MKTGGKTLLERTGSGRKAGRAAAPARAGVARLVYDGYEGLRQACRGNRLPTAQDLARLLARPVPPVDPGAGGSYLDVDEFGYIVQDLLLARGLGVQAAEEALALPPGALRDVLLEKTPLWTWPLEKVVALGQLLGLDGHGLYALCARAPSFPSLPAWGESGPGRGEAALRRFRAKREKERFLAALRLALGIRA